MSRPTKCRRVCGMPQTDEFIPAGGACGKGPIILTVDEYETIRWIDREKLSQEECSRRMEVARTTVQQIYTTARKKIADALVEARPLKIEGGQYRIREDGEGLCGCGMCRRRRQALEEMKEKEKIE